MKTISKTRTSLALLGLGALAGAVVGAVRSRRVPRTNPPVGQFVGVEGARLHYVQLGEGPDLVLLHGAGVNVQEMLAGPAQVLAQHYRVTAFDRPGHGHSDADLKAASAIDQAHKIHAAVRALGLARPVIVGHSLGGAVALAYGAQAPAEVSGVVVIAPLSYPGWGPGHLGPALHAAPGFGFLLSRSLFALWDPLIMRLALRAIFAPQKPTARFLAEFPREMSGLPLAMRADGADFVSTSAALHRLSRGYATYPSKVHIVVGAEDKVLKPRRQAKRLAKSLADARITVLPGLGHMLHHFAPEAVLEAIADVRARSGLTVEPARATPLEAAVL